MVAFLKLSRTPTPRGEPRGASALWGLGRMAAAVALSGGLGWLALRGIEWEEVMGAFRLALIPYVLAALGLFFLATWVRAYRWHLLFVKERPSLVRLFLVQNMGIGLNNISPVRLLSEPLQFGLLTLRDKINGGTAAATLGMERVLDLWASTMLLVAGVLLVPQLRAAQAYLSFLVFLSLLGLVLLRFLAWRGRRTSRALNIPLLSPLAQALALLDKNKGRVGASLLLSLVYWILVGSSAWLLALGLGIALSLPQFVFLVLGTLFFTAITPAIPGAPGTFEFAAVSLLRFFGITGSTALPFAMLLHATLYTLPVSIAIFFLPKEGLGSLREVRAFARRARKLSLVELRGKSPRGVTTSEEGMVVP